MHNKLYDKTTTVEELKQIMRKFLKERDWEQFSSPKNIAMATTIEAAELMEHFNWVDSQESIEVLKKKREEIELEVADVLSCLIMLSSLYDIDLAKAYEKKLKINKEKYPIEKVKGLPSSSMDL